MNELSLKFHLLGVAENRAEIREKMLMHIYFAQHSLHSVYLMGANLVYIDIARLELAMPARTAI